MGKCHNFKASKINNSIEVNTKVAEVDAYMHPCGWNFQL
jgi:hypothetical protein